MRSFLFSIFLLVCPLILSAQTKVACVGNSVTYGYLAPNREVNCYPMQLQRLLGAGYQVENFGHSGATLLARGHKPYIQTQEYQRALQLKPDIVVIHLGINDTDTRCWPNYGYEFRKDYFALIDTFRALNPKVRVLICRMSPIMSTHRRFKSGTRDWYWLIQKEIEEVAQFKKVELIDLQAPLYHRPDLLPDAVHPDAEGAGLIAQTVYQSITGDYGGLRLPIYYSDNMVLQRGDKVYFSGTANAGETVRIALTNTKNGEYYRAEPTKVLPNGTWQVVLNRSFKAGGDYQLSIQGGSKSINYSNVTFGDIWICSGQSNMVFTVAQSKDGKEFGAKVTNSSSHLRLFNMVPILKTDAVEWDSAGLCAVNRLDYFKPTSWRSIDIEQLPQFSAIAASFGNDLSRELDVPIGLICNAVGGSGTESWIDRHSIEHNPIYCDMMNDWRKSDFIMDWNRERAAQNIKLSRHPMQRHPFQPCYLYEAGMRPLREIAFKGFVWYQGESNAHNIELHEMLFTTLIESWRSHFTHGANAPFLFAQLSSCDRPSWGQFRDSQRKLSEKLPNVWMAVTSDKGDSLNVHPREKLIIGKRFAQIAMKHVYGMQKIESSGPTLKKVSNKKTFLLLTFDHAKGLATSDKQPPRTFEVEGTDGLFHPAQAELLKEGTIKLSTPNDRTLSGKVRYGFQPFTRANLINSDQLPASTFVTE